MDQYAAVFGRLHLLILHLPIGLVIGIVVLELVALFRRKGGSTVPPALLWLNATVALVAALSGLKLSQEAGYGGWTLTIHLWLGIAVAVVAISIAILRSMLTESAPQGRVNAYRGSLAGLLLLIILAGHYGGTMTHGEGFVLAPLRGSADALAAEAIDFSQFGPASEAGFAHVSPILAERCTTCHSGSRPAGGLALDSFPSLKRGSEIGEVVLTDTPSDGELLRRITLPMGDPDRMPPEGRRQLSEQQVARLRAWVLGAGTDGSSPAPAAVNESALEALRTTLAHAMPLAADSELLWIDMSFAQPPLDEPQIVDLLRPLAPQIGELSLARCAVTDNFAELVAQMPKLRRLVLHETAVTDATVAALASHPALAELVLTKTAVTDASIEQLLGMPALEHVYLWGSKVTANGAAQLAEAESTLLADIGEFAEAREVLAEADPKFVDAGPKPGAAAGGAVSLVPINTVCPVSGTAVNPKYLIVHEGKVIGFCCNNCPQQFWADPAKFADKLKQ